MDGTALIAALTSSIVFATSTSLQHHETGGAPPDAQGPVALLRHLLRRPRWLLGQVLAMVAFGLHALALHLGSLALVQPIIVSGIVLAVPLRAALSRTRPPAGEVPAVLVTAIGLATFLVASGNVEGDSVRPADYHALLAVLVGLAVAATTYSTAERLRSTALRGALYGTTCGVLFGMVAAMIKLSLQLLDGGLADVLDLWPLLALTVCGLSGVMVNQRAYRVAALSASLPALHICNVVTSLTLGILLFHEVPAHSGGALAAELFAIGCLAFGLVRLARHAEDELSGADAGTGAGTVTGQGPDHARVSR